MSDKEYIGQKEKKPVIQLGEGVSLRDWFAGQALGAIIEITSAGKHDPLKKYPDLSIERAMARDAYAVADAMLAEREKDNA